MISGTLVFHLESFDQPTQYDSMFWFGFVVMFQLQRTSNLRLETCSNNREDGSRSDLGLHLP